ncbi:MAG: protein kinase [Acidobacteria bacterium]|nr:protein kinase [Acidobacteriota bacterium]
MFDFAHTTLGRYEIREPLGHGGLGEVYCAFDTRLRRLVALKTLRKEYTANDDYVGRFRQEAFAASSLNHPNILTVFDIEVVAGTYIIATELIQGETLRNRIAKGALSVVEALRIAVQVSDALLAAHQAGVIHRDIKPENIMLRPDHYVKVLDFGIAKLTAPMDGIAPHTLPGILIGTPQYMSPEQVRGVDVDYRTDIWSLGVVLYEVLTARRPFSGSNRDELLKAIVECEPVSISDLRQDLSSELSRYIMTMLSKQPSQRTRELEGPLSTFKQLLKVSERLHFNRVAPTIPNPPDAVKSVPIGQAKKTTRKRRRVIKSVAILPFVNTRNDEMAEYLCDGITENIINSLSQLPQVRVMSRTSVFRFKSKDHDPTEVGRELAVHAVVTGKLSRVGSRLMVQTELVDVQDGAQLWGDSYNEKLSNSPRIQEHIATQISDKLQLRLSDQQRKRLTKRHTTDEEAYLNYLRGRFHWNKRSHEAVTLSIKFFQQAIEQDPRYAVAYAGLADAYVVLGHQHLMVTSDAYLRARAAATKALEFDDMLAEAHTTLGFIKGAYEFDWSGSENSFKRALQLNPGYATAHQWYSTILRATGRTEDALAEAFEAFHLDPLSTSINLNVASALYCARRFDEAIDKYRGIATLDPGLFWMRYGLALVYRIIGRNDEAIRELEQALSATTDEGIQAVVTADLAYSYGRSGSIEKAQQMIERVTELGQTNYISPCDVAVAHLGSGDKDQVYEWLEKAVAQRAEGLMWLKIDPIYDDLRSDRRFMDLLRRINLG